MFFQNILLLHHALIYLQCYNALSNAQIQGGTLWRLRIQI